MNIHKAAALAISGFGSRLKTWREAKGWTQADVGEATGLTATAVSHFECGQRLPSAGNLYKLCSTLQLPVGTLLGLHPEHWGQGSEHAYMASRLNELAEEAGEHAMHPLAQTLIEMAEKVRKGA